ncbi:MAG TPA: hypothetical protein VNT03_21550, partial [Baekduia sp.]|nr:hypothetical protein [Baekduia sp.]
MTRRTPLLLLLAAVAALAVSACGSSSGSGGGSPSGKSEDDKAYEGALKFAECMRDNGVDMPDPEQGSGGGIVMRAGKAGGGPGEKGKSLGPDNAKFRAAEKQCGKFLKDGGGRAPSPAEQAKQRDAFVGYARCMRSKGINFP